MRVTTHASGKVTVCICSSAPLSLQPVRIKRSSSCLCRWHMNKIRHAGAEHSPSSQPHHLPLIMPSPGQTKKPSDSHPTARAIQLLTFLHARSNSHNGVSPPPGMLDSVRALPARNQNRCSALPRRGAWSNCNYQVSQASSRGGQQLQ